MTLFMVVISTVGISSLGELAGLADNLNHLVGRFKT